MPVHRNLLEIPITPQKKTSGLCLMDTPFGQVRTFYLFLSGCELYIYREQSDEHFQSMHILRNA